MKRLKKKGNPDTLFDSNSLVLPFAGRVGDMPEEKVDTHDGDKTYGPDRVKLYPSKNRFSDPIDNPEWTMRTSENRRGEQ